MLVLWDRDVHVEVLARGGGAAVPIGGFTEHSRLSVVGAEVLDEIDLLYIFSRSVELSVVTEGRRSGLDENALPVLLGAVENLILD